MANIELPKDARGREIPLDTKVLYDNEGKRRRVDWYTFYPDKDKWDVIFVDSCVRFSTHNLSLTPPDSWEKLLDDLDRVVENKDAFYSTVCAYMNQGGATCDDCRLHGHNTSNCTDEMFNDIASRIRKLRGEDE